MNILYLTLAFISGLYANSLFNNILNKWVQYFVLLNLDKIKETFGNALNPDATDGQKKSKFEQRIKDAMDISRQN